MSRLEVSCFFGDSCSVAQLGYPLRNDGKLLPNLGAEGLFIDGSSVLDLRGDESGVGLD